MSTDAQKSALNFNPWAQFQTFRHLTPPSSFRSILRESRNLSDPYCQSKCLLSFCLSEVFFYKMLLLRKFWSEQAAILTQWVTLTFDLAFRWAKVRQIIKWDWRRFSFKLQSIVQSNCHLKVGLEFETFCTVESQKQFLSTPPTPPLIFLCKFGKLRDAYFQKKSGEVCTPSSPRGSYSEFVLQLDSYFEEIFHFIIIQT